MLEDHHRQNLVSATSAPRESEEIPVKNFKADHLKQKQAI